MGGGPGGDAGEVGDAAVGYGVDTVTGDDFQGCAQDGGSGEASCRSVIMAHYRAGICFLTILRLSRINVQYLRLEEAVKSTQRSAPKAGDVTIDPVHGDTVRWLEIGTDASVTRLELIAEPQASGPPSHIHPKSYERFEVRSGAVRLRSGREERVVEAGETASVSPGTTHTWHNHTDEPAVVIVEMDPGFTFAQFIDEWFEMARAGRLNSKGDLGFLQSMALFYPHIDAIAAPGIPIGLQRALTGGMSRLARLRWASRPLGRGRGRG